jgi:hypothetical protein
MQLIILIVKVIAHDYLPAAGTADAAGISGTAGAAGATDAAALCTTGTGMVSGPFRPQPCNNSAKTTIMPTDVLSRMFTSLKFKERDYKGFP